MLLGCLRRAAATIQRKRGLSKTKARSQKHERHSKHGLLLTAAFCCKEGGCPPSPPPTPFGAFLPRREVTEMRTSRGRERRGGKEKEGREGEERGGERGGGGRAAPARAGLDRNCCSAGLGPRSRGRGPAPRPPRPAVLQRS